LAVKDMREQNKGLFRVRNKTNDELLRNVLAADATTA
jgi:hypothetical protein